MIMTQFVVVVFVTVCTYYYTFIEAVGLDHMAADVTVCTMFIVFNLLCMQLMITYTRDEMAYY